MFDSVRALGDPPPMVSRASFSSRSRAPWAALVVLVALSVCGCRSPQSLCTEYANAVTNAGQACTGNSEYVYSGPSDRTNPRRRGCSRVASVRDPASIVNDCIPFLNDLADRCAAGLPLGEDAEYVAEYPDRLPQFCQEGTFQFAE